MGDYFPGECLPWGVFLWEIIALVDLSPERFFPLAEQKWLNFHRSILFGPYFLFSRSASFHHTSTICSPGPFNLHDFICILFPLQNRVRTPFREIRPGVLCAVLNAEDNTWYRAVIKASLSPQQVRQLSESLFRLQNFTHLLEHFLCPPPCF